QNSIIQTKSKSNRFYNSTSFKLFSTTIFILIGILLIINFRGYLGWNSGENAKKRIAVFPFDCNNNGEDSIDQPILLQSILVKNLISFKEFGVIDPNSLNEFMDKTETKYVSHHNLSFYSSLGDLNISYFIDGSVTKNESDFTIKTNIIDLKTHEVSFSYENKYSDEKNFLLATEDISSQVINFFQVKIHPLSKEKDLTPWVSSECDNMLALKSFMQASQIIYRQEPGAEKYLRQALEYDSCYTSPRIWLISHLVAVGNYEEAKKHMKVLDRLEAKANPFEQAMINYTRAYINDDLSKQIQYLCVALEYSPNNNILLYSLARLYYLIGDYQKSADTISNTINMNWSFSPAYSLGGDAYYRLKKYDNAKDIFEQALNISPVYKYIYSQLSVLYLIENDTITANKYDKQFINRSKELGMTLAETYFDLAEFYFEEKFYLSANKYYKNAIKENPNNPIYHEQLANCYNKQGDVKTAKKEFLQTINLDSLNFNSHFMLGNIFLKENIKDKAKQHFISYLGIDSISPRADTVNTLLLE
ncbi:MAG: tetratricopeptide repeat protein, partial [Ignavibacteriae bacterium]|nr:tetratricopeptide repeat protein [Ignavibacteriota bacterium]